METMQEAEFFKKKKERTITNILREVREDTVVLKTKIECKRKERNNIQKIKKYSEIKNILEEIKNVIKVDGDLLEQSKKHKMENIIKR